MGDVHAESPTDAGNLAQRAVRGGAVFLSAKLLTQVFQWAVTLLVVRLLEPEDYSMMTLGTLFTGIADVLAEAGVGKALVQKRTLEEGDVAQSFTLAILLAGLAYAFLFALAPFVAAWKERSEFAPFLRVLALLLLFTPFRSIGSALLERGLSLVRQSFVQLGAALVQAGTVLALAWLGFGYWALAVGVLLNGLLQSTLLLYVTGWRPSVAWLSRRSWATFRYGMQISVSGILWMTYSNADFAVVAALFDDRTLGFYSVAFELMSLPVQKISANVNQVLFSLFSRYQDDPERLRDWYLRLLAIQTAFAAPALIGLGLVAGDGLPLLLGEHWTEAVLPFQILCPVGVFMVVSTSLLQLVAARGRPDINTRITVVCMLLYPASFWLAGRAFGVAGVSLVWLVLYPCIFFSVVHLTRETTRVTLGDLFRSQRLVLGGVALMSAAVVAMRTATADLAPGWRLGASIAVGAAVYGGWVLALGRASLLADLARLVGMLRGKSAE